MRHSISRMTRRAAIHGWLWYLPAIAAVIGVLAFDAYLNVENLRHDYEIAELKARSRELNAEMLTIRSERAQREELNQLVMHAEAMGLREAGPGEIVRIAGEFIEPSQDVYFARAVAPVRRNRGDDRVPVVNEPPVETEAEEEPVALEPMTFPVAATAPADVVAPTGPMPAVPTRGADPEVFVSLDESLDKLLETL